MHEHCLRPSLEPAFAVMTQRLLAAKWDADAAQAAQEAEEAARKAALAELLAEEEEGSAAQVRVKAGGAWRGCGRGCIGSLREAVGAVWQPGRKL